MALFEIEKFFAVLTRWVGHFWQNDGGGVHENAFLFRADNSDPHGMGQGVAHIPRRAGGERFVMPSLPAGVCLALLIVCAGLLCFAVAFPPICIKSLKTLISLLAILRHGLHNAAVLFMVSLTSATKMRQL